MKNVFQYKRRVEFRDTDMAGIVHFSVFFAYMEEAEHEFLRTLGLGVFSEVDGDHVSWPRVAAECNYRTAIRFEDEIVVEVSIVRIGRTSLTWGHQMFRDQTVVAEGRVTAVCCRIEPEASPQPIAIPPEFVDRLTPYLAAAD